MLATWLAVSMIALPPMARAQRQPEKGVEAEVPKPLSGTTSMSVQAPGDTEVMQGQRGSLEPLASPSYPVEQPINPDTYVCGRGDVFELNFWGRQNFKLRVTADLEGRTFLAKIGYVDIVGKSLSQARKIITQAVHRYYPGINFDMSLVSPRSFMVHVVGYIGRPGAYVSTPIERVATLLARAGGINGSRRRIEIQRRSGARINADLLLYETSGDLAHNPLLIDGDVVSVPYPRISASIGGAVKRPGRYELVKTKDLAELLELAGGFTTSVTHSLPIRVVRRDSQEHNTESRISFSGDEKSVPVTALHDDDQVAIPSTAELQRSVLVIGPVPGASAADEVTLTRRFAFVIGSTVRTVLEEAGPLGASADLKGSYIRKANGSTVRVDLEALLMRREFAADRPVDIGDTIVVPQKRRGIAVEGAVFRPMVYPFNPQFHGAEYIAVAGGPKQNAQGRSDFRVIDSEGRVKRFSDKLTLEPGDTIMVPERTFSRAEIVSLVLAAAGMAISAASLIYLVRR